MERGPRMTCGQIFEHDLFFEMSFDKVLCKVYKAKVHKRSFKRDPWLAATDNNSDWKTIPETGWQRTVIGRYGGRELCILYLSCLCSIATSSVLYQGHQSWGHRPHYFANEAQRWSTVAIVLLNFCYNCYELMTFWSNKIASLPNQKPSSYADNGNMSLFSCQSVMVGQYCTDTVNENTNILVWHADISET